MEKQVIDISEEDMRDFFDKDKVTLEEISDKMMNFHYEIEALKEKIRELTTEDEEDVYDKWKDYWLCQD